MKNVQKIDLGLTGYGSDMTWSFNSDTGELTICGEGELIATKRTSRDPWVSYLRSITSVRLVGFNSIQSVFTFAFDGVKVIAISDSVRTIYSNAFAAYNNYILFEGNAPLFEEVTQSSEKKATILFREEAIGWTVPDWHGFKTQKMIKNDETLQLDLANGSVVAMQDAGGNYFG